MPAEQPRVHVSIGSRFENIELVQVALGEALERLGLDEDDRHWIDLVVREAVANAIKHGNREDPAKRVEIDLELEGGELIIRVVDQGAGFDPDGIGDPRSPENLLNPNGRGIFYMKSFMDTIDYGPGPEGGTTVTLRKRLGASPEGGVQTE